LFEIYHYLGKEFLVAIIYKSQEYFLFKRSKIFLWNLYEFYASNWKYL